MSACDFIVIGAGIAGASAAHALSSLGRVVVLERESAPGYHTTGRSAAQFLESYGNESTRCLTRASRDFLQRPPEGFTDSELLHPRAAMFFAREDQLDSLDALYAEVGALTPGVERLSGAAARGLVPVLRRDYVAGAMLEPDSMDIDVDALHQGFLRGARRRGTTILCDAEVRSLARREGAWEVDSAAGRFSAPVVVNAAGAWCDAVAGLAGAAPIGLVPKRRTVITFDPPPVDGVAQWPLTVDVDEQLYFKPESGRLLGSPADETPSPPCDAQPEEIDVAIAVDRIERATTLDIRRIVSRWAGLRSFAPDKSLVVGADASLDGLYWAAGQGGYGIQTSPAVGLALAGLIGEGDLPAALRATGLMAADLAPSRLQR
jgi:D-arginine dehydrogenase